MTTLLYLQQGLIQIKDMSTIIELTKHDEYDPEDKNEEDDNYLYVESVYEFDLPRYFYYKIDMEKDPLIHEELLTRGSSGNTIIIENFEDSPYSPTRSVWANFMLQNNTDANLINAGPRSIGKVANARWWVVYLSM